MNPSQDQLAIEVEEHELRLEINKKIANYPFSSMPPTGKMICFLTCLPRELHPADIIYSIWLFDLILNVIFLIIELTTMQIFHKNPTIFVFIVIAAILSFIQIVIVNTLRQKWKVWFMNYTLLNKIVVWLLIRTGFYICLCFPLIYNTTWLFWRIIIFFSSDDGHR